MNQPQNIIAALIAVARAAFEVNHGAIPPAVGDDCSVSDEAMGKLSDALAVLQGIPNDQPLTGPARAEAALQGVLYYPAHITEQMWFILGMPNFQCGPYAHVFREAGAKIERRAEPEQAYVIDKMLRSYLVAEDKDQWAAQFDNDLHAAQTEIRKQGEVKNAT